MRGWLIVLLAVIGIVVAMWVIRPELFNQVDHECLAVGRALVCSPAE